MKYGRGDLQDSSFTDEVLEALDWLYGNTDGIAPQHGTWTGWKMALAMSARKARHDLMEADYEADDLRRKLANVDATRAQNKHTILSIVEHLKSAE